MNATEKVGSSAENLDVTSMIAVSLTSTARRKSAATTPSAKVLMAATVLISEEKQSLVMEKLHVS